MTKQIVQNNTDRVVQNITDMLEPKSWDKICTI